jgi:hypothetical protein
MTHRTYMRLVTLIFLVIGVLHLYRAIKGYPIFIGSLHIAAGWSWLGALVALYLSYQGYKHNRY